ncbi:MAG: hypothetical protein U9Q40_07305 [Campylobacterota bacterium]|nr:hypothetical protein [Campylobacterota bacterium]
MNRINPIHIGVLLLVILLFVAFRLSGAKSELQELQSEYKSVLSLASKVSGLQETYADKAKLKRSIRKIVSLSSLKSENIEHKMKKNGVSLSSKSISKRGINILMAKILNSAYNIDSFKIKKLSDEKVSFEMEIKW